MKVTVGDHSRALKGLKPGMLVEALGEVKPGVWRPGVIALGIGQYGVVFFDTGGFTSVSNVEIRVLDRTVTLENDQ